MLVIPNTAKNDLSAKYTSPLKLFAHMASGVPIVCSKIPSLQSIVSEKQVTFFQADSSYALAGAVGMMFDAYEEKEVAATELKQTAKKYTWTNRASSILSFISR
jgi:glycosyltransferase involved in cell wall biosynthesis